MSGWWLSACISNLVVSASIAGVAWFVQRGGRRARLAHLLWLLVLVKLVTPPLVTLPLLEFESGASTAEWLARIESSIGAPVRTAHIGAGPVAASPIVALAWAWGLGSAVVLLVSLTRVLRFDWSLRARSAPAPHAVRVRAGRVALQLGLARTPRVLVTNTDLAPLLWWFGGAPRVVLPSKLVACLEPAQFDLVLAHEFAHLARRDHVVRWLEWLACVLFWWNPIAWIARHHLRVNEELCCDALVLAATRSPRRTYAGALLDALELLTQPVLRPPAAASSINSGGVLERRLTMILSNSSMPAAPRRALAALALVAVGVLPLGLASAQEPDYETIGARLVSAVEAGELSATQAKAMMGALASARFDELMVAATERRAASSALPRLRALGYIGDVEYSETEAQNPNGPEVDLIELEVELLEARGAFMGETVNEFGAAPIGEIEIEDVDGVQVFEGELLHKSSGAFSGESVIEYSDTPTGGPEFEDDGIFKSELLLESPGAFSGEVRNEFQPTPAGQSVGEARGAPTRFSGSGTEIRLDGTLHWLAGDPPTTELRFQFPAPPDGTLLLVPPIGERDVEGARAFEGFEMGDDTTLEEFLARSRASGARSTNLVPALNRAVERFGTSRSLEDSDPVPEFETPLQMATSEPRVRSFSFTLHF